MIEVRKVKLALIISLLIIAILAGSNVWLLNEHLKLQDQIGSVPVTYFFFQDSELSNSSGLETWRPGFRDPDPSNISDGNIANITSGLAHLCYNETSGLGWSTSSLSQGDLPHNWSDRAKRHSLLLGGCSQETSNPTTGITFSRCLLPQKNEFALHSNVEIVRREFLANVTDGVPKNNVGLTLYCSYTQKISNCTLESDYFNPANNVSSAIYIDIFFSSYYWNSDTSGFEPIEYEHSYYGDPWTKDYVVVLTAPDQVETVSEWEEITVDMGWVLNYTFNNIPSDIESITVRGVQIYSESIGCLIDSRIDYVKMEVNNAS